MPSRIVEDLLVSWPGHEMAKRQLYLAAINWVIEHRAITKEKALEHKEEAAQWMAEFVEQYIEVRPREL